MQKKIIAINDLSGLGKCSLTVALPVISSLKVQCCPLTTAVLSNQTEFDKYEIVDLSEHIKKFFCTWLDLGFDFDMIYSGFLASSEQVDVVIDMIGKFPHAKVLIDPVMADSGSMYPCFGSDFVKEHKKLVTYADIVTPNITEALLLTDRNPENYIIEDISEIETIADDLHRLGPDSVIITGIRNGDNIGTFVSDKRKNEKKLVNKEYIDKSYSGTGDIYASIMSALLVRDFDIIDAANIAADFISDCVRHTAEFKTDRNFGVLFEDYLYKLASI